MSIKDFSAWGYKTAESPVDGLAPHDDAIYSVGFFNPTGGTDGTGAFTNNAAATWLGSALNFYFLQADIDQIEVNNGFSGSCFGWCTTACSGCYDVEVTLNTQPVDWASLGAVLIPGTVRVSWNGTGGSLSDRPQDGASTPGVLELVDANSDMPVVASGTVEVDAINYSYIGYRYQFLPWSSSGTSMQGMVNKTKFHDDTDIPTPPAFTSGFRVLWRRTEAPIGGSNDVYLDYVIDGDDGTTYADTVFQDASSLLLEGEFTFPALPAGVSARAVTLTVGAGSCFVEDGIEFWFAIPQVPNTPILSVGLASTIEELLRD